MASWASKTVLCPKLLNSLNFEQMLTYGVEPNLQVFWASLRLMKKGELTKEVSPGFHPYFNGIVGSELWIPGAAEESQELPGVPRSGLEEPLMLRNGLRVVRGGTGTKRVIRWTDGLDDVGYGCVEPVASTRDLRPGESMTISMTLQATTNHGR
jgi:hypothetical protein